MEITIAHDSTIPLHMQLLNQLRHLILSGQWAPGSRLPSEAELQRQLKISRSTIRQALSNAEAEGLIERVPGKGTFVARSPAGKRNNHLIGYITFDFLSDFQHQLLRGAESAARARGYRILFCNSNRDANEENRLLDQLLEEDRVGGTLIWPALDDDPSRRLFQLANQGVVPLVMIDRTLKGLVCDYVTSDNYAGAYAATKHLVELGHRRIVFLSRPILQLLPIAERLRGYRQALHDAGLTPLEPWLVGTADQEMGTGYVLRTYSDANSQDIEEIARYLENPQRPTAIFAMNDLMAIQALKAASRVGLRVPQDLSLVGFDDIDLATYLGVPLTTVPQDTFALGRRAAELLIERIEGYNGPPRREVLPTRLKIRASTAPPALL
ncbi:MAG: GntR family transcriptional regulator [Anaerolineae bacterium]